MDQETLRCCPFCQKRYKKPGNHYKSCPERNGRDYEHLLSQKTIAKKNPKPLKKKACPRCGGKFERLETHLRVSATCRVTPIQPLVEQNPTVNPPSDRLPAPSIEVSQQSSITTPSLHHPTSPTHTPMSHNTILSNSFVPSIPPLQSKPGLHPSPRPESPSPPSSFVSHYCPVPLHPDITDITSCFVSHPCNVSPSSVTSHPHEHTPCQMSFVQSTHAHGTHPSHAHTHPTNVPQLSLTHPSHSTPIVTLTPPQSHNSTSILSPPSPHHTSVVPPPPHPTTNVAPPPPYPITSVVPPSPHPITSVVPPPPHHTTVVPPPPHHTSVVPPPLPHPGTNDVSLPTPCHPTSSFVTQHPLSHPPASLSTPLFPPTPSEVGFQNVHLLPRINLPKEASEWKEADCYFREHLVPKVYMGTDIDEMNRVLCSEVYEYFAGKRHVNKIPSHQNPNRHHQHPHKAKGQHQRALKAVKEEKKQVKKQLRALRKDGTRPEEIHTLAKTFHHLVRQYSKLSREMKYAEKRKSRQSERRACYKNFWRFAENLLNEDGHTNTQPSFTCETAETFFRSTYSNSDKDKSFHKPAWMPDVPPPTSPFYEGNIIDEELLQAVKKCKASSAPSPVDQIPYRIFKNCPSLMQALLHLFNICWSTSSVPSQWKIGVLRLLGKPAAKSDPSIPSNFRPIALTSCIGKLYTSILKTRWTQFMIGNGYLNTTTQKAFVDGVSGCTEHHIKLLSIIEEARKKHKSLAVCWLDLANAFGSVHHQLIRFSLEHYHAPPCMIAAVSDLYQGLVGVVRTEEWSTKPFPIEVGVFQGDPLSVIIFNTVMNTLVDTISQHQQLGFSLSGTKHSANLLQFADDTSLLGKGPAACKALLDCTSQWLEWSGMKPKVPKCCSLAVQASSGRVYDPQLSLCGQTIPFIGDTTFKFLGAPVTIHNSQEKARSALLEKLRSMLSKVDATLLTIHQKLRLYRDAICPRLTWDLSTTDFPISWVKKNLDTLAIRYLKRWTGLAKPANTSRLFLPKSKGGLQLPSLSTTFKKLQCAKAACLMSSRDPLVRHLASQKTLTEASAVRQDFKPYQQVVEVMQEDPGVNRKTLIAKVKNVVVETDTQNHLQQCSSLAVQGHTMRQFSDRAANLWAEVVQQTPDTLMRFAMNSVTDTLPHNANLHLWGKKPSPACQLCPEKQTLHHVLNHCSTALEKRRYNKRHDDILASLYSFASCHLKPGHQATVDLPGEEYCFPQDVATTDSRPDLVIWSQDTITLIELTICFEEGMDTAAERKRTKYADLLARCASTKPFAHLTTIEVGSRGFINSSSFDAFYRHLAKPKKKMCHKLETEVVQKCLERSHDIWCKRNWLE